LRAWVCLQGDFVLSGPCNSVHDNDPAGYDRLRSGWLNQRRADFIIKRLRGYGLPGGSLVVEIGSGAGGLLNRLGRDFPEVRFVGIEPLAGYVDFARAG